MQEPAALAVRDGCSSAWGCSTLSGSGVTPWRDCWERRASNPLPSRSRVEVISLSTAASSGDQPVNICATNGPYQPALPQDEPEAQSRLSSCEVVGVESDASLLVYRCLDSAV